MNVFEPGFSAIRKQSWRSAKDRVGIGKPLVQTQVIGQQDIPINPVFSKRFGTPSDFRHAIVVDSVAVGSSRFNRVQQLVENRGLNTKGLRGGLPGREPGPEPDSASY